jgi:hypothetical protein
MTVPKLSSPLALTLIAVVGALAIGFSARFLLLPASQPLRPLDPPLALAFALAAVAAWTWAGVFTWLYWRKLDEAAKEAQKFAWFFGGLLGVAVTAPVIVYLRLTGAPFLTAMTADLAWHGQPGVYVALGWISLALAEVLGFLLVWAGWWWARR